jgi:DNA-binding NarL/FixJ family response regulator
VAVSRVAARPATEPAFYKPSSATQIAAASARCRPSSTWSLAAAGRTNRAIAQELYVTPETVEVHLCPYR